MKTTTVLSPLLLTILFLIVHSQCKAQISHWTPITKTLEFEKNCPWAGRKIESLAVNCAGTLMGYTKQPLGNKWCPNKSTNVLVKSTDGGKTWTDLTNNLPFFKTESNVGKGILGTGYAQAYRHANLVINGIYSYKNRFYVETGEPLVYGHFLIMSDDEGKTWQLTIPEEKNRQDITVKNGDIIDHVVHQNSTYIGNEGFTKSKWDTKTQEWVVIEKEEREPKAMSNVKIRYELKGTSLEEVERYYSTGDGYYSELSLYSSQDKGDSYEEKYRMESDKISYDQGENWWPSLRHGDPLLDCGNQIIKWGRYEGKSGLWLSADGEKSWNILIPSEGVTYFEQSIESRIDSTGRLYGIHEGKIYQSKVTLPCSNCSSTPKAPIKKTYGTTIITHGITPDGVYPQDGGWMDRMATAILMNANSGRLYYYNKESGDFTKLIESGNGQKGEDIILFDWSDEALEFGNGSTEAAADALFASLILGNQRGLFELENLHFIGHGRGCTVNSLAVERLYQSFVPKVYGETVAKEISIGQVTNLGPFDAGHNAWWEPGDVKLGILPDDQNDAHPNINIMNPQKHSPNNGVIAWKGIYSDTYWQNNGKVYLDNLLSLIAPTQDKMMDNFVNNLIGSINKAGDHNLASKVHLIWQETISKEKKVAKISDTVNESLDVLSNAGPISRQVKQIQFFLFLVDIVYSNLEEREVDGTLNFNWKEYDNKRVIHPTYKSQTLLPSEWIVDYIGICDAYTASINEAKHGDFDKNDGGFSISRLNGYKSSGNFGNKQFLPNFDYFENLNIPGQAESRIRGIMNGSFDRKMGLILKDSPGWSFHGGGNEGRVSFDNEMAALELLENKSTILRHNRLYVPTQANSISFDLKRNLAASGKLEIIIKDIASGKTTQNEIAINEEHNVFKTIMIPVDEFHNRIITFEFVYSRDRQDDNTLPDPAIIYIDEVKFSKAISQIAVINEVAAPEEVRNVAPEEIITAPESVTFNGTFESIDNWDKNGGTIGLEKQAIYLKPHTKKQAASLKHQAFDLSENASYLQFFMHKSKIVKADIEVIITDIQSGTSEVVFLDQIRISPLDKLNSDLDKINVSIENLDFDNFKEGFDEITIDISAYGGKQITLEFSYTPIGNSKPKLYLDDIQIID